MNYDRILSFKGTWRDYQARVLENSMKYLEDGRVHIVAAPGSGKTTLGIELIKRLGQPALVLTPSITIREQWEDRIAEAFLIDGLNPQDYLSQDLREPRVITIATYQSLHSAVKRLKNADTENGSADTDEDNDDIMNAASHESSEDYSGFDIFAMLKENAIGVLCLDECHHLRTEWWKALEEIKSAVGGLKVIALTATPPYDSTPSLWKRYTNMCGEIDVEITVPELVKEGSLCPHQDYIYFNYPTAEEEAKVGQLLSKSNAEQSKKLLANSIGKANSIRSIVMHEYSAMGKDLRLLILTDYIKRNYERAVGDETQDVNALGVLPFFEQLRRAFDADGLKLGVLCGTLVVIPATAKEALLDAIGNEGKITFSAIGSLPETEYLSLKAVGNAHFLTGAVTDIFTAGYMQALIGTKSLLGEGWDAPCVNSLILASFVGSFMLSNQMRGRAIRIFKDNPDKTSNIWHLVCLNPRKGIKSAVSTGGTDEISEDLTLLKRRMEHFQGLHYSKNTIESGIERLDIIAPVLSGKYTEETVAEINEKSLALSEQRDELRKRWQSALAIYKKPQLKTDEDELQRRKGSAPKIGTPENSRSRKAGADNAANKNTGKKRKRRKSVNKKIIRAIKKLAIPAGIAAAAVIAKLIFAL